MITGAGGSIGSELCRQVAQFSPKRLILFERSEFNLYQIHMNLLEMFPDLKINAIIGDLLNQNRVEQTLAKFMPEVVFHAAAYKHVPLMEMNPIEALQNNIQGTSIIARCAHVIRRAEIRNGIDGQSGATYKHNGCEQANCRTHLSIGRE